MSNPYPQGSPFMANPTLDGYRKPHGTDEVGRFYTCLTCGAAVSPSAVDLHDTWHEAAR